MSKKKILTKAQNVRVAKNFITSYGKARFRDFLTSLENGVSGQTIATGFGVSRERVRQWKNSYGITLNVYYPTQLTLDALAGGVTFVDGLDMKKGSKAQKNAKRVTKNFVKKKGVNVFARFINDIGKVDDEGKFISGEKIGNKYGMSRERVRQLRKIFGKSTSTYIVHTYINALRK